MTLEIIQVPCFTDNYAILLHEDTTGETLCVDAPEARPILQALAEKGWKLTTLLITHKHADHVGGIKQLKEIMGCKTYGPKAEARDIPELDESLTEGDSITFAGHPIEIIETPGHTSGHISYYWPEDKLLFAGDTLFVIGSGRLFEGTPAQMWQSLNKLMALPDDTKLYCGHEYTLSNAEFASRLEPGNIDLQTRLLDIRGLRAKNQSTLPSTIGMEKRTNPFLRPDSDEIKKKVGMPFGDEVAIFGKIRELKNKG
jgi:hydroxyacylglutathione hydrolase